MAPVIVEAEALTLTAKLPQGGEKQIVQDVSIKLKGFVALLGASGGGKTTLLRLLSCRFMPSSRIKLEGEVRVNGKPVKPKEMMRIAKLVPQFDNLLGTLTARELLHYQACLCMNASEAERKKEIERVNDSLSLHRCIDTRASRLSGGEQRRVSVALELLTKPKILFLDEPTSGLDSHVAFLVVETLHRLAAEEDCTVVCSIHQPSARIVRLFSDMVVLDAGQVVYQGHIDQLPGFLDFAGIPCPPLNNPAEHLLDSLDSFKVPGKDDADSETSTDDGVGGEHLELEDNRASVNLDGSTFVQKYAAWGMAREPKKARPERASSTSSTAKALEAFDPDDGAARPVTKLAIFSALVRRNTLSLLRNKQVLRGKIVAYLFMAFILATTFLNIPNTQAGASRILSLLFLVLTQNSFSTAISALSEVPADRALFSREYANGLYPVRVWWSAKMVVSYIYQAVFCQFFVIIVYFATGLLRTPQAFFLFDAALLCITFTAVAIAYVLGSGLKNPQSAFQFFPVVMLIPLIFSGFLILPNDIPVWYIWIFYISFIRYGYSLLVLNQFDTGLVFEACNATVDSCPFGEGEVSGSEVISTSGFDTIPIYGNFVVLVVLWVALVIVGALALKRTARRSHSALAAAPLPLLHRAPGGGAHVRAGG
ncbi:ABC transporter ATP-binding protein/permease wht-1, partial [Durusdinium trenchii]